MISAFSVSCMDWVPILDHVADSPDALGTKRRRPVGKGKDPFAVDVESTTASPHPTIASDGHDGKELPAIADVWAGKTTTREKRMFIANRLRWMIWYEKFQVVANKNHTALGNGQTSGTSSPTAGSRSSWSSGHITRTVSVIESR